MDIGIIKNPFVIGIFFATVTYLYIYWENENKHKKNPKAVKEPVSLITPAIVGLISWFIASNYFPSTHNVPKLEIPSNQNMLPTTNNLPNIANDVVIKPENTIGGFNTSDSRSYHLIGRNNIRLPQTDVFIDVARF